jgi:hypothetical protein
VIVNAATGESYLAVLAALVAVPAGPRRQQRRFLSEAEAAVAGARRQQDRDFLTPGRGVESRHGCEVQQQHISHTVGGRRLGGLLREWAGHCLAPHLGQCRPTRGPHWKGDWLAGIVERW